MLYLQSHSSFFGERHQLIPISIYKVSPGKYKRILCEQHSKELVRACQQCERLVCSDCDLYNQSCLGKCQ